MLKSRWLPWLALMTALFISSIGISVYTYRYWRNYVASQATFIAEIIPTATAPAADQAARARATPDITNFVLPQPWNGKERLNILLMGIDQRTNDPEKVFRTDTMLVLSIDPASMQAGMLSIPRDLWVPIPGYKNNRINTANAIGDNDNYPGGGGPQLARKTVESALGVRIHHYVRLNFSVFESVIDRMGGIEVDVPADIRDESYPTEDYGTEVFSISAGKHTLDGATALKYARTRHDSNGDFGRARRQQQVILAIRDRMQDPRVFASMIWSAPDLIADFGTSIRTDMTLDQMQQLAVLAMKIDRNNIKSAVLDQKFTDFATTPDGAQVLVARRDQIAALRQSFFGR
jgi:LCP family protein required for cell wall assembly